MHCSTVWCSRSFLKFASVSVLDVLATGSWASPAWVPCSYRKLAVRLPQHLLMAEGTIQHGSIYLKLMQTHRSWHTAYTYRTQRSVWKDIHNVVNMPYLWREDWETG
jgi:hypothetical protein